MRVCSVWGRLTNGARSGDRCVHRVASSLARTRMCRSATVWGPRPLARAGAPDREPLACGHSARRTTDPGRILPANDADMRAGARQDPAGELVCDNKRRLRTFSTSSELVRACSSPRAAPECMPRVHKPSVRPECCLECTPPALPRVHAPRACPKFARSACIEPRVCVPSACALVVGKKLFAYVCP